MPVVEAWHPYPCVVPAVALARQHVRDGFGGDSLGGGAGSRARTLGACARAALALALKSIINKMEVSKKTLLCVQVFPTNNFRSCSKKEKKRHSQWRFRHYSF